MTIESKRPFLVSLLSVFFGLGVVLLTLALVGIVIAVPMETPAAWLGLAILVFAGACLTLACRGLWVGKSIGWECAVAYYIWSLIGNGLTLFQVSDLEDIASVTGEEINLEFLYIKHGARVLIAILVLAYMLGSSRALQWLQVDPKARWQKGIRPLTIGIVLASGQVIASLLDEIMMF